MDFTPEKRKQIAKWLIGIATVCILIFLGVQNIGVVSGAASWCIGLVMPLLLGGVIAVILNVPMSFFEAHVLTKTKKPFLRRLRRPICFVIALLIIIGTLVGVVWLVIPELVDALKVVVQGCVGFISKLNAMSEEELAEMPFGKVLLSIDLDKILDTVQDWLKNEGGVIVNTAFGTVTSFVGGIFDFFIALVFAIYILFSKDKLKRQMCRLIRVWLPKGFGEWFIHAGSVANTNFRNFISGQSLEAVILGLLCMLGMFILQIPYAPMVGVLVGVTALIPIVGAFIGTIVGAFMILTVDPIKAVIYVVFLLVLQQIEGNLIYPRVMGSRVNLPGMWILAAVTVGGSIGGPAGMLLSVPISSTAYVLFREATQKREKNLEKPSEKPSETPADTLDENKSAEKPVEKPAESKPAEKSVDKPATDKQTDKPERKSPKKTTLKK
ncbi:MAG: AI-2E family transporter [Eubacteriales bacterium]